MARRKKANAIEKRRIQRELEDSVKGFGRFDMVTSLRVNKQFWKQVKLQATLEDMSVAEFVQFVLGREMLETKKDRKKRLSSGI